MEKDSRIFIAGHRGLVGSALVQVLKTAGYHNLITRTHHELDLADQKAVDAFFTSEKPAYVFLAAAKVGGIVANSTYPADFIRINLAIELNVIDAAYRHGAQKLLFLGSSCIYPKRAPQPIKEEYLLTGPLEETNRAYAIAKIAGIELCRSYRLQYGSHFISAMPTNLYGSGDNFDLKNSHVIPALIRKFHEAKMAHAPLVTAWGTGSPRREFLHVDDLAQACLILMERYDGLETVNIGVGEDITIKELTELVKETVGYAGNIHWDTEKPDGTPRKLLDSTKIRSLGWTPRISLQDGLSETYAWYQKQNTPV